MLTKSNITLGLMVLLVSACAPGVVVETPALTTTSVVLSPQSPRPLLNQRLGLAAYPGSVVLKFENRKDGSSEASFESRDPIERVYGFFHGDLIGQGWNRTVLEAKSAATKLQANYIRNGVRFKLSLDQEGRSGRYRLEVEF